MQLIGFILTCVVGLVVGQVPPLPSPPVVTPVVTPVACRDSIESCEFWARIGECDDARAWMRIWCKKACQRCPGSTQECSSDNDCQQLERCRDLSSTTCRCSSNKCIVSVRNARTAFSVSSLPHLGASKTLQTFQPLNLQVLLSLLTTQQNLAPSLFNIPSPLVNTHPTTLDIFLGQTTLSLTSFTRTLDSARPLAAADVVALTSFLTQVGRNLILQGHSDPTGSALINFLMQVVSSLCPSAPTCTSLAPSTEAPTNTALDSFTASAALQPASHHLALINTLNSATVAMATSTSATPGAGFASFFTVLAQRLNSLGSTGLASFIGQLALTVAV